MGKVSINGRSGLLAIFVLSGFAGLIYQSIWSRYLGLFLGHAAYAQALVLAIFMGGMALGSAWTARAGQNWRNLIRSYAIIEAVIGAMGLVFHVVFNGVVSFSYDWLIPHLGTPWLVQIARWLVAAMLILPQTILLGMTFPLMSAGLRRRFPGSDGSLLGGLYFTNSIGAAFGALASVFLLLPTMGLPGAISMAAVLNFIVAGLALHLSRDPEPMPVNAGLQHHDDSSSVKAQVQHHFGNSPLLRTVLLATALSGAASFVYEIVWIRMLSMAVGSTMHAFELMLASFIAGIALGGLWVSRRADQSAYPLRLAGWMQVAMGVAALASLWVYSNAFEWVGWMMGALARTDGGYQLFNLGTATIAMAIMLPAAFFAGTTLPLFTVALLRAGQGEASIGRVYAWNTLGSIVGVFAAIHWLIPTIDLKNTLCVAAAIDMLIGVYLLRYSSMQQPQIEKAKNRFLSAQPWIGAGAVGLVLLALAFQVHFDPLRLASGVFRYGETALKDTSRHVAFYKDGKTASISVLEYKNGVSLIATNGKPDASIMLDDAQEPSRDEPTMLLAAVLPLSMIDKPDRIGVIGFGSGMTTHTFLGDPRVKQVDTIEIEPTMVEGAKLFGSKVARAYTDPRSNIIIDDAKAVFSANQVQYDIIISEPSNPWISGVGALFSKEFYQFIPRHIKKDGIFVQWLQSYEVDEQLIGSILNALAPHFDDYGVWLSNGHDLLIVASPHGALPKTQLDRLFAQAPLLLEESSRLGIRHQADLDFRKVANKSILKGLAGIYNGLPVNSDFHPVLGLDAPRTRYKGVTAEKIANLPTHASLLLETLNVRQALPSAIQPSAIEHFNANPVTTRARMMALDLLGKDAGYRFQPWMNGSETESTKLLKSVASMACQAQLTDSQWLELAVRIRAVSEVTITMLPADMLENIWVKPSWLPCNTIANHDVAQLFALLSATARRDYQAMEQQGRQWFANPIKNLAVHQNFDNWALQAVLLSLAHRQDWSMLLQTEKELGTIVVSKEGYLLDRFLLRTIAQQSLQ